MSTRTERSNNNPLSSSSRGASLAARASSDHAPEVIAPLSEPLSYSQAMGGSAGFRVGEGMAMSTTTTTTTTTKKDNASDSIKSKVARFAARFVCVALVMCMVSLIRSHR